MIFRATTLQEANLFLPFIKEGFAKLHALALEAQALQNELEEKPVRRGRKRKSVTAESLISSVAASASGGVSVLESIEETKRKFYVKRVVEIEEEIKSEISLLSKYGIVVKGLFPPRVEFFAEKNGQPVILSWQGGDKRVWHWHGIDEEFDTRKPIEFPESFGPVVIH